jgi:hypothetical protein
MAYSAGWPETTCMRALSIDRERRAMDPILGEATKCPGGLSGPFLATYDSSIEQQINLSFDASRSHERSRCEDTAR